MAISQILSKMANRDLPKEAMNCTAFSIVDVISFISCVVLWSQNKFSPNPIQLRLLPDLNS